MCGDSTMNDWAAVLALVVVGRPQVVKPPHRRIQLRFSVEQWRFRHAPDRVRAMGRYHASEAGCMGPITHANRRPNGPHRVNCAPIRRPPIAGYLRSVPKTGRKLRIAGRPGLSGSPSQAFRYVGLFGANHSAPTCPASQPSMARLRVNPQ